VRARRAQEDAVASAENQIRQAIARVGQEIQDLAWTVGRDEKREAKLRRRWRMLEAALGIAATVASRKAAARLYSILTGEPPPQQRERELAARRRAHDAVADEPTSRERAETAA
jgi:hypothetical protein